MGGTEISAIQTVFEGNWIAPAGEHLTQFEQSICHFTKSPFAVALNSGTSALHLALQVCGIQAGDYVLCSSLTFAASANPILYQNAIPIFIDSEPITWNICPNALEKAIQTLHQEGKIVKALIVVHIFGMPAQMERIKAICEHYEIQLIEDAAESLGSTWSGQQTGTIGEVGIYSFNGNKIITTSGGGALVCKDAEKAKKTLFLATQAKEPFPYFQHETIGYNYRLSNVLAAIGCEQMKVLPLRVAQRRAIFDTYKHLLSDIPYIQFQEELEGSSSNRWLTVIRILPNVYSNSEKIRLALLAENIEARPIWKPLHLQPVFQKIRYFGSNTAAALFEQGLCLPSGSALTTTQLEKVVNVIRNTF
jgi:pyridoxal phosphate-dependent aminotransferase EpsN